MPQTSRIPIADEAREEDGENRDRSDSELQANEGFEGAAAGHGSGGGRAALMRSLLRPKPIAGVENFGIPPSPEGEVNPGVQVIFRREEITLSGMAAIMILRGLKKRNPHTPNSPSCSLFPRGIKDYRRLISCIVSLITAERRYPPILVTRARAYCILVNI